MRILLISALLVATASCAWPPPPPAEVAGTSPPPQAPVFYVPNPFALLFGAILPGAPPAEVAGTSPPPPAPVFYAPNPFALLFGPILPGAPPPPGRLTLGNFSFEHARVEALITPYPDCASRQGTAASNFELPLNGTRVIEAAPGSDVCWRRQIEPGKDDEVAPATRGWSEWNRVFTSSGRSIDSRL